MFKGFRWTHGRLLRDIPIYASKKSLKKGDIVQVAELPGAAAWRLHYYTTTCPATGEGWLLEERKTSRVDFMKDVDFVEVVQQSVVII